MENHNLDPIDVAMKFVGNPDNKIYNDWFYNKTGVNAADCGTFVSYCRFHGGMPLGTLDWLRGFASVPNAVKIFTERKQITTKPVRNDIVFFDFSGHKTNFEHTGLFKCDNGDGITFTSIEANTSTVASQGHGGNTMEKKRPYTVAIFAHPAK